MEGETIEHVQLTSADIKGDGDRDTLESALSDEPGVRNVTVDPNGHTVEVAFDPREVSLSKLKDKMGLNGYKVQSEGFGARRDALEGDRGQTP
jgi:copper chaperone CopZ